MFTTEPLDSHWNNPKGLKAAARACGSGTNSVKRYGNFMWEWMCANWEGWRTSDLVVAMMKRYGFSKRGAQLYVSAFYAYCKAAHEDFHGPASKLTRGGGVWKLTDSPD